MAGWWFFLRPPKPPAGIALALAERPHRHNARSQRRYRQALRAALLAPPHTVSGLIQHTDTWAVLAGLSAVASTPAAQRPLPPAALAALRHTA
ncbi:hypothetical protein [Sulfobacillus sp. hq2]|uniref:hypothetical protein n=1 Tax=Sulfobacillus sp. hq2 TaxID=2039167 RepID=UPI000CD168AF|nr:hypothetical protein [Sulfobacillus sp. hq2]POB12220.1 hypothetical protein CO251_00910 [Sulfobacillus sp. hq2]